MNPRTKAFLKFAAAPLIVFGLFLISWLIYDTLGLPDRETIVSQATEYYRAHGMWTVFIAALIEGMLFVNWYFPGSVIVVLGVVLAKENGASIAPVLLLITAGFFIASLINYALGRYGWYHLFMKLGLEKPLTAIRMRVESRGLPIIFSTYLHPNLGALTATSAGILRLPFALFTAYSIIALALWNTLWGIVVALVGPSIIDIIGPWLILAILLLWIASAAFQFKQSNGPATLP